MALWRVFAAAGLLASWAGAIGNEDLNSLSAQLKGIGDDVDVTLVYLEYPLANIGTQEEDWSAYHSGIAFVLDDERAWTIDYRPRDPEHLMNFIRPHVHYTGQWPFWNVTIDWQNEAYIAWDDYIDNRFTNLTEIGKCKMSAIPKLIDYSKEFQRNNNMFQPISIVQNLNRTIISSTTCHDYVQGAIHTLYQNGATFHQTKKAMVFRDAVLVFSDEEPTVIDHTSILGFLKILVYWRYFSYFVPAINRNFIHARAYLNEGHAQDVSFVLHSDNTYYQLYLRYPFIDYCYTTIHLPKKTREDTDLTNRFRHCKFTKAKFPDKDEGKKKISDPLAQAFSSRLGWLRESVILLIPAALKIQPLVGYAVVTLVTAFFLLIAVGVFRVQYLVFKAICGCSNYTFLTTYAIGVGLVGFLLSPLALPMHAREPNDIRNWGGKGSVTHHVPDDFNGVYEIFGAPGIFLAVDFTHGVWDDDATSSSSSSSSSSSPSSSSSSSSSTGVLELGGPSLTVTKDISQKPEQREGWMAMMPRIDGLLVLRLLQLARAQYHITVNPDGVANLSLSLLGTGMILGASESGKFWQNILGAFGELEMKKTDKKKVPTYSLQGECDKENKLVKDICSSDGRVTMQLSMLMDKDRALTSQTKSFDTTYAETMSVGVAVI